MYSWLWGAAIGALVMTAVWLEVDLQKVNRSHKEDRVVTAPHFVQYNYIFYTMMPYFIQAVPPRKH